jgi:hypothetical protein
MGYRSDVTAVFYTRREEDWPALKLFVDENFPDMDGFKECLKVIDPTFNHAWGYMFDAEEVKWYESYESVRKFEELAHKFVEIADGEGHTHEWSYEFARVGEDTDDVETDRSQKADCVLHVSRKIVCDF